LLDEIKLMLRTIWMMIWGKNVRLVSKVEEHQRRIEGTQEELKDYLSQIRDENLSTPAKRASKSRSPYKALRRMSLT
jgi:Na+/phosphate symporter